MNIEVMEQLLKDLAANVGYDLIPSPFDTPFVEASVEGLPDSKQFFWTVPASVLNSKEQEEFRKMCIEADIIARPRFLGQQMKTNVWLSF